MRSIGAKGERMVIERAPLESVDDDTTASKKKNRDEGRTPIDDIFDRMGGAGRVKIERKLHPGEDYQYVASMALDAATAANLEELLSEQYGGGQYGLRFTNSRGQYEGHAVLRIDQRVYPPVDIAAVRRAQQQQSAPQQPQAPPLDPRAIVDAVTAAIAPVLQKVAELAQQKPSGPNPMELMAFIHQQERQHQVQLVAALTGKQVQAPDPVADLERYAKIAQMLGFSRGEPAETSMSERVLSLVAPKAMEVMAPALNAGLGKLFGGGETAPAAPPAPPPVEVKDVTPPKAAPPAQRPPREAVPISDEVRARWRASRDRANAAPASGPPVIAVRPEDATPPPRVKDVAPEAVELKK